MYEREGISVGLVRHWYVYVKIMLWEILNPTKCFTATPQLPRSDVKTCYISSNGRKDVWKPSIGFIINKEEKASLRKPIRHFIIEWLRL